MKPSDRKVFLMTVFAFLCGWFYAETDLLIPCVYVPIDEREVWEWVKVARDWFRSWNWGSWTPAEVPA